MTSGNSLNRIPSDVLTSAATIWCRQLGHDDDGARQETNGVAQRTTSEFDLLAPDPSSHAHHPCRLRRQTTACSWLAATLTPDRPHRTKGVRHEQRLGYRAGQLGSTYPVNVYHTIPPFLKSSRDNIPCETYPSLYLCPEHYREHYSRRALPVAHHRPPRRTPRRRQSSLRISTVYFFAGAARNRAHQTTWTKRKPTSTPRLPATPALVPLKARATNAPKKTMAPPPPRTSREAAGRRANKNGSLKISTHCVVRSGLAQG